MERYVRRARYTFWGISAVLFLIASFTCTDCLGWLVCFSGVCATAILMGWVLCDTFDEGFDEALVRYSFFGNYALFGIEKTVICLCLCHKDLFDKIVWHDDKRMAAFLGRFVLDVCPIINRGTVLRVYFDGKIICQRKISLAFCDRLLKDFRDLEKKDEQTINPRFYYDELKTLIESKKSLDFSD